MSFEATHTWQSLNHQKSFKHLFQTGYLSDCSFTVSNDVNEKVTIKCHKLVLIAASPVFETMFTSEFKESRNSNNINMEDASEIDLRIFLEYLYAPNKEIVDKWDMETLLNMIYLSKKFMVNELTDLCMATIFYNIKKFHPDEIVGLFLYGKYVGDEQIINLIHDKYHDYPNLFQQSPALLELNIQYFYEFIQMFRNGQYQNSVFLVIEFYCKQLGIFKEGSEPVTLKKNARKDEEDDVDWETVSDDDPQNDEMKMNTDDTDKTQVQKKKTSFTRARKRKYLEGLLKLVDYERMSPIQFCHSAGSSILLSVELKYKLLYKIILKEAEHHFDVFD